MFEEHDWQEEAHNLRKENQTLEARFELLKENMTPVKYENACKS